MSNPAELLEQAYLNSLNFVERGYYNLLSKKRKEEKIAEFGAKNPDVVKNILS